MALSPRLELRQSQSLVMTPQLQQAIKMLQLSNLDLAAYVDAELERNPLLERDENETQAPADQAESIGESTDDGASPVDDGDAPAGTAAPDLTDTTTLKDAADTCDTDIENLYPDAGAGDLAGMAGPTLATLSGVRSTASGSGFSGEEYDPMANVAGEVSLKDHLTAQMLVAVSDPAQRLIAATLIDLVDEAGYLTESTEEVAARLGAGVEDVEGVLAGLCGFEPAGVFARTLADCLTYQLAERGEFDEQMQTFMANLDLVASHDLAGLARACNTDKNGVADLIARIRRLNPKPGLAYGGGVVQPLIPDVHVRALPDGSWAVELNSDTLPRVLIDQSYYTTVARNARSAPEKTYLSDCLADANWLVKSLDQRARTILKVSRQIVRQQDAFLVLGVAYLRPLTLKTVADAIEMHESTVSRVTANKYIATPRGIFQMKYFFSSAISSTDGSDALSAEAVRYKLKALIEEEKPPKILSDDRLVELLRDAGIDIARRTVAKYREAMNIPSSVQRRRAKRACA